MNKTMDMKSYQRNYYINNKDKWRVKKGSYIYSIMDKDQSECLYIGSTNNIKNRISYHKCKKAIKRCNQEHRNYKVVYIELDKDEPKKNRCEFEMFLIKGLNPAWNKHGRKYNENKDLVRNLIAKYNGCQFKEFNN